MSQVTSAGYKTGEFQTETHKSPANDVKDNVVLPSNDGLEINGLVHGRDTSGNPVTVITHVAVRLGRTLVEMPTKNGGGVDYCEDVTGWESVYLKITHPTSASDPASSAKLSVVKVPGTNSSKETYIRLYSLHKKTGEVICDYRHVPVVPIYE